MTFDQPARQSPLERIRRNAGFLLAGGGLTMILGLVTLGLNARALGPHALGLLALAQAYVTLVGRLFSFDTWQGLVKFGAAAEHDGFELRAVTSLAVMLDALSSWIGGIAAVGLIVIAGPALGFPKSYLVPVLLFCATLFIQLPTAPAGIMRLRDKFHWIAGMNVAEAVAKAAASGLLFAVDAGLQSYFYAFAAIQLAVNAGRIVAALRLTPRPDGRRWSPVAEMRPLARSFLRFSSGSWVVGTINVVRLQGAIFLLGVLLGPAGASYYAVAQKIAAPIYFLADQLRQAVFPELSRLAGRGEGDEVQRTVRSLMLHTAPPAIALLLGAVFFGDAAIGLVAGLGYGDAYWILVGLTAASCLYLCMPVLSSLVILYAGMRSQMAATVLAALAWALAFPMAIRSWGVAGAGLGEAVFVAAWFMISLILLRSARLRRLRS